jgi:hypothetical protein
MSYTRYVVFGTLVVLAVMDSIGMGLFNFYNMLRVYPPDKPDDVVKWENNIATLKGEIPADQKVIGYVSDWDRTGYDKDVYIEFVLTTYALAPRLLVRNIESEWIIANSTDSKFIDWLNVQIKHPFSVRKFGNGLYLIHQGDP